MQGSSERKAEAYPLYVEVLSERQRSKSAAAVVFQQPVRGNPCND